MPKVGSSKCHSCLGFGICAVGVTPRTKVCKIFLESVDNLILPNKKLNINDCPHVNVRNFGGYHSLAFRCLDCGDYLYNVQPKEVDNG